jgi:hypothetical protein
MFDIFHVAAYIVKNFKEDIFCGEGEKNDKISSDKILGQIFSDVLVDEILKISYNSHSKLFLNHPITH